MEKFHPHLHAMVSDGLFRKSGVFYVMPKVDLEPLEEIFRAKVLKMLKAEEKIGDALINNLMSWKHTGFSIHNGVSIAKDDDAGKENVAQYGNKNLHDRLPPRLKQANSSMCLVAMTSGPFMKNIILQ